MADFCDVTILGHIGQDPEIRTTPSGKPVARCSIAVNKSYTDRDGTINRKTEWIKLVAFNRSAEIARDYIKKGQPLVVRGTLQTTSWFDKEKQVKMSSTEVVVFNFSFISSAARTADNAQASEEAEPVSADEDDQDMTDIPF